MKKRPLLIISLTLLILFAGLGLHYLLSFRKVTFELENNTKGITLYTKDKKEIKQLSSNGNIYLKDGDYSIIPEGDNLSKDNIPFSVSGKNTTVTINPSLTDEFLSQQLIVELPMISSTLSEKYPTLINGYTLSQGKLYEQGQWFGGLLKPKVSDIRERKDPYRIILHKVDNKWEVVRRPEYVLSASRYQDVPQPILRDVNDIVGEPGN